jgi:FkbM family methyltransferase
MRFTHAHSAETAEASVSVATRPPRPGRMPVDSGTSDAMWLAPPLTARVLSGMTRLLPPVRGSGWLALSVFRKLYRGPRACQFPVWPGVRMALDPRDYLGGTLAFVPHLYDRWERRALASILRAGDVFVDVGGNIGAYALWAASLVGATGRVLAVEPDDQNHRMLTGNIRINGFEDRIATLHCGISDKRESRRMHRNETGNCGGHNFIGQGVEGRVVECLPLHEALEAGAIAQIRLLKLDIEGFERRVLECYFKNVPPPSRPDYLLVEIDGGPAAPADKTFVRSLVSANGYILLGDGANTLFRKNDVAV